jgi:tripartite ATP-independent transporter DctP family solute receptor
LIGVAGFSALLRASKNAGGGAGQKIVLKLGHGLDQTHPVHAAMEFMAQRLKEKSGGSVELLIYSGGQLGTETENMEQVQRGALAMTKTSAAPIEALVPEIGVFSVPFIFRDEEHFWKVLEGPVGRRLLGSAEKHGMHGLCYFDSGARSFYTVDRPVLTPDDLKGRKIRVMLSKTSMDMIEALGGSPTPVPWGELYTALQQKMIDGAENNPPSLQTSRHFEVCKHYALDEHTRIPDILWISQQVWDGLPPHVRTWVQEAADEASVFQRKLWREKTEEALKDVEAKGVRIYRPDKAPFAEKVRPMQDGYQGTPIGDLIAQIREVR